MTTELERKFKETIRNLYEVEKVPFAVELNSGEMCFFYQNETAHITDFEIYTSRPKPVMDVFFHDIYKIYTLHLHAEKVTENGIVLHPK